MAFRDDVLPARAYIGGGPVTTTAGAVDAEAGTMAASYHMAVGRAFSHPGCVDDCLGCSKTRIGELNDTAVALQAALAAEKEARRKLMDWAQTEIARLKVDLVLKEDMRGLFLEMLHAADAEPSLKVAEAIRLWAKRLSSAVDGARRDDAGEYP